MSASKRCDVRGRAKTELSADAYIRYGRTLGRQLPPTAKFVVGGDVRDCTPPLLSALIAGLCQEGLDVVDLGLLPAPMICYAKHRLRADGCAIVAAPECGEADLGCAGLKWMLGDHPPTSPLPLEEGAGEGGRQPTTPRTLDVSFDYVAGLQETFVESLSARQHVVIDPMRGCWAGKARRYLHAVFPQCLFSTIHDQADGGPGDDASDCLRADNLGELCGEVYRQRAHLGVAFDRGGERLALVDGDGVALGPEETACALLECLGQQLRGERFVCDMRFSNHVAAFARRLGAEPLVERSGQAFIWTRMYEAGALFGAEPDGRYFHRTLEGGADGLYTACRLIAYLARSGRTLAELRRGCPPVYITPELRVPVAAEGQATIIERVRAAWADFPQSTIDGVRIEIPGGWGLVRCEPAAGAMAFRFEGLDWHALEDIVRRFCNTLPECGEELWNRYQAALGGDE